MEVIGFIIIKLSINRTSIEKISLLLSEK